MKECRLADGKIIAYRETGAGRPLVLLHGWAMSSAVFTEVMADLASDYRVLAPDLPGHGFSSPGELALPALRNDLCTWLDSLAIEQPMLLGWSLGGMIALNLARQRPRSVERLLLVATTPRFVQATDWSAGLPDGQVRAMGRDLGRNFALTMTAFFQLMFADEELTAQRRRAIADFAVRQGRLPEPRAAAQGLDLLRCIDQRPELALIDCPTLIEHGARDVIVPVAAGRHLAAVMPEAKLIEHPDCGHAPFLSSPRRSLACWRDFLP